ncbi:MAG: hypothetical protein M3Y89_02975 [Actinomycetota bacterium]|nr:hypothetical protein [Actinomycetota bacterium]
MAHDGDLEPSLEGLIVVTAWTVRFCRTDPGASPAALVAAWLIDALAGQVGIELSCSNPEIILLGVASPEARGSVRQIVHATLEEARFAGWELACE